MTKDVEPVPCRLHLPFSCFMNGNKEKYVLHRVWNQNSPKQNILKKNQKKHIIICHNE